MGGETDRNERRNWADTRYDSVNRLTSLHNASGTFSYGFNADGNITSRTHPDSTAVGATYDADGRLASVSADGHTTSYGYDPTPAD